MTRRSLGRAVRIADAFFQAFRITPTAEERDWFENSIRDELLNFASELVVEEPAHRNVPADEDQDWL